MSTTNLFVELIVIGVGAAGWLVLFALAALGPDGLVLLDRVSTMPAAAVPAIVVVYLLGILIDRVADVTLHALFARQMRTKYFVDEAASFEARGFVVTNSEYFATQFDYSRSRQRICRGWMFNAVMLAVALNVFLLAFPDLPGRGRAAAFGTTLLVLVAAACWFSWQRLADTELKRIRDQAALLQKKLNAG